jgi:hypothetical protein
MVNDYRNRQFTKFVLLNNNGRSSFKSDFNFYWFTNWNWYILSCSLLSSTKRTKFVNLSQLIRYVSTLIHSKNFRLRIISRFSKWTIYSYSNKNTRNNRLIINKCLWYKNIWNSSITFTNKLHFKIKAFFLLAKKLFEMFRNLKMFIMQRRILCIEGSLCSEMFNVSLELQLGFESYVW